MARKAGSIPAVPPAATGELYSFLQAVRQSLLRAEELLNITEAALEAQLAELEGTAATATDLTALTTRVTTAEGEIDTLQSEMNTAEANILLRADKDQLWECPIFIEYPTNKTYRIILSSVKARTITIIAVRTGAGTCTVDVQIDGVTTNTGTIAASTSQNFEYPTSANVIGLDQDVTIVITSASGVSDLSINLLGVEVLS